MDEIPATPGRHEPHPSDSAVQREIETAILQRLDEKHPEWSRANWSEVADDLGLTAEWAKVQPDAAWRTGDGKFVIAEVYCRTGALKPGHRRKIASDALKLSAIQNAAKDADLFCILVAPPGLEAALGNGWLTVAVKSVAEIIPIELTTDELQRLEGATELQAAGQSRVASSD